MRPLLHIIGLWRGRALWLALGLAVALAALAAGVGLMAESGALIGGVVLGLGMAGPAAALRLLGPARVVGRYLERLVSHDALFRALADVRVWFFRGVAERAAGGLGFRRAGDVLARLVGDVEALDGVYLRLALPLAGAVLLLPALAWLIGARDPWLALVVCLLFALAAFVLPWRAGRAARAAGGRLASGEAGLRIAALDTLVGLREVRAYGAEGRMMALVQAREASLFAAQHELSRHGAWAAAGGFLCGQAALLAVLLSVGTVPASAALIAFLVVAAFEAAGGLTRAGTLAGRAATAAARVVEAAEGPVPVPEPASPAPLPPGVALRFEGVGFRWRPELPLVLDGLTLEVPEGARVALLGPSGSGKSTLAALALKVVAPGAGRVLLGGVDLARLAAGDLRRRIAWLGQTSHLFDDTIRANLLLGDPAADEAGLWAALEAARIADVVRALPDGLDSWVGEGGARFSGGQGRRLALARTLLSPAPLLILDEPCAGLDAETERAFFTTLNETAEGRTILLIAHRLTGAERLDRIWRLSAGRAVAAAG